MPILQRVANQVAVAVDNTINFESMTEYQQKLSRERDRLRILLDATTVLVSHLDLKKLTLEISAHLKPMLHHDLLALGLYTQRVIFTNRYLCLWKGRRPPWPFVR
jgi:hypothetical protein